MNKINENAQQTQTSHDIFHAFTSHHVGKKRVNRTFYE